MTEAAFPHAKKSVLKEILTAAALLYLVLPNLLFLFGWFRFEIALPLGCCLIAAYFRIVTNLRDVPIQSVARKSDIFSLFAIIAAAFFAVWCLGFHGQIYQYSDHNIRRAIYCTLCRESWPICNTNGDYFVYYHTFWLIPAALSHFMAKIATPMSILSAWCFIGFALSFSLFYMKNRGSFIVFLIILLFNLTPDLHFYFSNEPSWTHYQTSLLYQNSAFNHSIPTYLCAALLYCGRIPKKWIFFPIGMLFSQSSFSALLLGFLSLFVIDYKWKSLKSLFNFENITVGTICAFVAVYLTFYTNSESGMKVCLFWTHTDSTLGQMVSLRFRIIYFTLLSACLVVPLYVLISSRYRKLKIFRLTILTVFLLPLIWMGRQHNEFLYKGSLILGIMTAILWSAQLKTASLYRKLFIIIFLAFSSYSGVFACFKTTLKTWPRSESARIANIRNEWNEHLDHPDSYEYKNFFKKTKPQLFIADTDIFRYIFK